MSWKLIGIIESRAGDLEIMPDWTIGTPNDFDNLQHALLVRDSMQAVVDQARQPRSGGEAPKLPPIKYMVIPAIDASTIEQLKGNPPPQQQQPQSAALSFGH